MLLDDGGQVMTDLRAGQLLDEGCDFVLIGRAGTLARDLPLQVLRTSGLARCSPGS
ncbi:hypothetical protein ACIRG5_27195 [Lentzea sp. NPDC102401]|uniref:hypothetical protein n=1 Tax=Lentzea sp. NPDC102401 TaxID=3364128 RepID=UPI0038088FD5